MNNRWPTREKDMHIAQLIMEEYAHEHDTDSLGLFELVVDQEEKSMNFRLSDWVLMLARHFKSLYGDEQGDFVTRKVVSRYITKEQTLH